MNDDNISQADTSAKPQPTPEPLSGVRSGLNKEAEPVSGSEYIVPSTPELELPEEVEQAGATVAPEHPKLTKADRRIMEPAKESVPISPIPAVKLSPLSDEEIAKMKSSPITDSRRFRVTLYELILKRLKEGLLRLGG